MPRTLIGGLIQAAAPITDPAVPMDKIRKAAIDAHIPLIEDAGRKGVQILGLQEICNGPYFCPSQDPYWHDIAEAVPGPTTELMAQLMDLDMIEQVRRVWQFYRDRRPETHGSMAEQLP